MKKCSILFIFCGLIAMALSSCGTSKSETPASKDSVSNASKDEWELMKFGLGEQLMISNVINGDWIDENKTQITTVVKIEEDQLLPEYETSQWIEKDAKGNEKKGSFGISNKCGEKPSLGGTGETDKYLTVFLDNTQTCYSFQFFSSEKGLKLVLTSEDGKTQRTLMSKSEN